MMWLAHKLFNIINENEKEKANKITLSSAYDEYLKKYMGNFKHSNLIYNQRGLKDANLRYMRELYTLLNYICNTIADYNKFGAKSSNLSRYSVKCFNQYISLYNAFPKCDSYLYLLAKLKKIYEEFRIYAIGNDTGNNNLDKRIRKLTAYDGKDSYSLENFKAFDFNVPECKPKNKDNIPSARDKATKTTTIIPKSENQGGDQRSQKSTHKNKDEKLKVSESESQQQKNIQLPKLGDSSLKDEPQVLNLSSNDTDTQKSPNGQINRNSGPETSQDKINMPQKPKGNHYVFDLSTLEEYEKLFKTYIEEYKKYVTSSLNDIQKHLYDNIWPTLNKDYSTYADYYKNFNIMEYLKEVEANGPQKIETLKDKLPSKENGGEDILSLPDSETPELQNTKTQDPQTQISNGQGNNHSQESLSTPEIGSTSSEQEKILDVSSKKQLKSSDDYTNIMPNIDVKTGSIRVDVEKGTYEIGFLGNLFKGQKLVVYSVIVIAILVILAVMYKVIERKLLNRKLKNMYYYIFCVCIKNK